VAEWKIEKGKQSCGACGAVFTDGAELFSALLDEKTHFIRKDFCAACWPGVDRERVFAFWLTTCEEKKKVRKYVDESVIMELFTRLGETTEEVKINFRYILALMLMRKKLLKFTDVVQKDGQEYLVLVDTKEDLTYEVLDPRMNEEQIEAAKEEAGKLLNMPFEGEDGAADAPATPQAGGAASGEGGTAAAAGPGGE